MTKVIGLGHYSRTGKDTLAHMLADEYRQRGKTVEVRTFATPLKHCCHLMFAWAGVKDLAHYENNPDDRNIILPALGMSVVDLWIYFGTDLIREKIHTNTWVNCTLHGCEADVLIISDVRFPNEVAAIQEKGGKLVKVSRPGAKPRTGSKADAALLGFDGWDEYVYNKGSIIDLRIKSQNLVYRWELN